MKIEVFLICFYSFIGNLINDLQREGYLRTSCMEYSITDTENQFIHLTNNAIQKYSENYGQFENGNQLSF
jgi:predicted transcriptional regulator